MRLSGTRLTAPRPPHRSSLRRLTAAALVAAVAVACTAPAPDGASGEGPSSDPSAGASDDAPSDAGGPQVRIDGDDLVLERDDGATVLATVPDADLLHAAVRPGHDDPVTILVLTRDEDGFALRYLDVADGQPSDLFGFPFRLQVDPDVATVADVPPVPVWSPDGERVAWLEWTRSGTRLRTLGWLTYEVRSNPSDDRGDWDLVDVPVGTQLEGWEIETDGTPVLVSRTDAGERWRIRLEDDGPIAASGPGPRT